MPNCPQLRLHHTCCSAAISPLTSMPSALAAAIGSARCACTSQSDAARFHTCRLWGPRHRRLSVMQCVMKRKITVASTPRWVPWPWAQVEMSHLCELGMRLGELQLDALPLADALQRQPHLRMSQDSTSTRCWAGAALACSRAACQSQLACSCGLTMCTVASGIYRHAVVLLRCQARVRRRERSPSPARSGRT